MKLLSLKLENFQGLRSASFNFNGKNASISGDNATGKTTVFNAVTWLLFDKASTAAKNFTPKTKSADGDMHYLDHAAEAQFRLISGRLVTLRKVFREVYKKKRGSPTEEFAGHETDYFLDGVPSSEREYSTALLAYGGGLEKMKILTMPAYFAEELPWGARREILLDLCGDISDEDVIRSTPELEQLWVYLLMPGSADQYYSVDEYRKIAAVKKTEINKELIGIPSRIDEATRAMPSTAGIDKDTINSKIKNLTERKEALEAEKAQMLNSDMSAISARVKIAEANAALAEAKAAYTTTAGKQNDEVYVVIAALKKEQIAASNRLADRKNDLAQAKQLVERTASKRENLIAEYKATRAETWDEGTAICPACRQELPKEKIQELREAFNLRKSARLEEINSLGQEASATLIAEQIKAVEALVKEAREEKVATEDFAAQLSALHDQLHIFPPFETTAEYAGLASQITSLHERATNTEKQAQDIHAVFAQKLQVLQTEILAQESLKADLGFVACQRKRIAELAAREKELARQYEDLERGIYLCELFVKTKVNMLTERINSKFQSVSFRLFVEQINGGIREDCEVMIPSEGGNLVPYAFANHGARVNAGLEIINTLSRHWGLTMPVIIDNAESVTRLMPVDTQVIRLVVSEPDKILRLEIN